MIQTVYMWELNDTWNQSSEKIVSIRNDNLCSVESYTVWEKHCLLQLTVWILLCFVNIWIQT